MFFIITQLLLSLSFSDPNLTGALSSGLTEGVAGCMEPCATRSTPASMLHEKIKSETALNDRRNDNLQ